MRFTLLLVLPLFLHATQLSNLIEHASASHISLESMRQKLATVENEYSLSRNFSNPDLSLSLSDIQFKDVTQRSLEPMQYAAVNIKQKIPFFGKRDAQSKKVKAKECYINMSLQQMQVKLTEAIRITAYTIYDVKEKLENTNEYIKLTKQNIELYGAYALSDTSSHMALVSAQLSLWEQKIKQADFSATLESLYKQLTYLSGVETNDVEFDTSVVKPKKLSEYLDLITSNKTYKQKKSEVTQADADLEIKKLSYYSDPIMQAGYFHREKFEDYANIGVAFSLPIYGNESAQEEIAKKNLLAKKSETQDLQNLLHSEIEKIYISLENAYKVYNIVQNESLQEMQHLQDLGINALKNGSDLFVYNQILQKKLSLENQKANAATSYFINLAKIDALTGKIQ